MRATSEALQPFQVCLTPEAESRVLSLIPGPVVNDITGAAPLDQGSVLAVRVFGSLSIYFTPQPEVVPKILIS